MTDHDEAIDRLLDVLAAGGTSNESSLDAQSVAAAKRLFVAGQDPQPDQAFRNRLESMLFEQAPAAAGSVSSAPNAGFGIALQPGLPRWRPRTMLATAAILALVMLSALSVVRLGDSPSGGSATLAGVFQAASVSAHSDLDVTGTPGSSSLDCSRPDFSDQELAILRAAFPPLLFSKIPASQRMAPAAPDRRVTVIAASDLPSGTHADEVTQAAVRAAFDREVACRNAGANGWGASLAAFAGKSSGGASATPTIEPIAVPSVISMTQLEDGRVGVLLATDLFGAGLQSYMFFLPFHDDWLAAGYALVGSSDWIMASYDGALSSNPIIVIDDVHFSPPEAEIPANQPVTLTIINQGSTPHTATIERLNVSVVVQPGQTSTVDLNAPAGSYPFVTDLPNNGQWEVVGIIWAIDASSTATPAP